MAGQTTALPQQVSLFMDQPLSLASGAVMPSVQVGYQTYGTLNDTASNAVLICHALTGDQYVASDHPVTGKAGWWTRLVGPGKIIDTNRYFVICSNVLGGCLGTSGPAEVNPDRGKPWGLDFPVITLKDMVCVQKALTESLGIDQLFAVIGGSMGGMQVLQWLADYPESVFSAIPIATAARHTAQNIAFHEVGRQAIMADPNWRGGAYLAAGVSPDAGLSVARMAAHITYMSEDALAQKFGRNLQDRETIGFGFEADFQVESYLRHQGSTFVDRFDANSYLYITRAMDYFDLASSAGGKLAEAFRGASHVRCCALSFSSDWLYPPSENKAFVHALNAAGARIAYTEIESGFGHDAFLMDVPEMDRMLAGFITRTAEERGLS